MIVKDYLKIYEGAQWLSGRVLDSRPRGLGFEPHRRHCDVALEQDTFILVLSHCLKFTRERSGSVVECST